MLQEARQQCAAEDCSTLQHVHHRVEYCNIANIAIPPRGGRRLLPDSLLHLHHHHHTTTTIMFATACRAVGASSSRGALRRAFGVAPLQTVLYTSPSVTSVAGRGGTLKAADGSLDLTLTHPKALGGATEDRHGLNPETLFAGGYAACFKGALNAAARQSTPPVKLTDKTTVVGTVQLGKTTEGKMGIAVQLDVTCPDTDSAMAKKLVEAAHHICPYSHATRGNIVVTINVA
jgi:osmotically inducible protein OsmC